MKQFYINIESELMKIILNLLHKLKFKQNDARTSQGIHVNLWYALDKLTGQSSPIIITEKNPNT